MSSFSALGGAFSSLTAQRIALEVTSQNIANVNTPGYTRQRANLEAITTGSRPTMLATDGVRASGVRVSSVDRLGDIFLETKLRTQTSAAGRLGAVAESWQLLETTMAEPGEHGLAASLDTFFAAWQDVANRPDDHAARSVLFATATTTADDLAAAFRAVENQWAATRSQASAVAQDVNTTASAVADLNGRIRDALVSGDDANTLIDQRGLLVEKLAGAIGGEVRQREDGTIDVMVGGNALVRGDTSHAVAVHGGDTIADLTAGGAEPGPRAGTPRLVWAGSTNPVGATGGRLSGLVEVLGPDGPLATMAGTYDSLATTLADEVNTLHQEHPGADGVTRDFFALDTDNPAISLRVALDSPDQIVSGRAGEIDGSLASRIADLTGTRDQWASAVVDLGVDTRTAIRRSEAAEITRSTAEAQLMSQTSVDLDEEGINLVMYQRAYEAAARVLTTIDQMLDTLINRTGVVGR